MGNEILSIGGVTAIVVLLVSALALYVPGLRVKWAGVSTEVKQSVVGLSYLSVGAVVAFGGCLAFLKDLIPALLCVDGATFFTYAIGVLMAAVGGQLAFPLLPKPEDVRVAKAERAPSVEAIVEAENASDLAAFMADPNLEDDVE